ncbi:unknown [Methanoculleus sp. CAG:1088]|nr:unknown [Methanoculleus sp. CAG:1088]
MTGVVICDCPFCGGRDTSDLKSCWDEDGAHVEVYQCVCGCRFSVTLEVLEHPSR